jgi:alpha-beta hydrolase superfamily lysophospholipase
MRSDPFTFKADDGKELFVYRWRPEGAPRAVVHIAHGMAEHAARYERLAEALTAAGYVVYANDHRGHGKTAQTDAELGFFARSDGFRRVMRDIEQLVELEKQENPGLPVVLFGHSMGSFLAQALMIERGQDFRAVVLSGSSGKPSALASVGKVVARVERARLGERGKSPFLDKMSFDRFNAAFKPARTGFDWLSRDQAEVDKYIADPRCGFACAASLWVDLLAALSEINTPERQSRVPKDLPVYIFAGSRDPVGENTQSLDQLIGAYRRAGLRSVTHRFYPGGRHEMLNETNRDEVTRDLIAWLDAQTG